jgi:hypothetical protein
MRPFVNTVLAFGFLAASLSPAVARDDQCARPIERTAFNITGLKSQLMVTAISCQAQAKYNEFVARFRTDLMNQERTLNSYFRRTAGRGAQKAHDDYITQLANAQSEVGIQSGTLFCDRTIGLFDEVLALKTPKDLPMYAAEKSLSQPIALTDCPPPPVKLTRTARK